MKTIASLFAGLTLAAGAASASVTFTDNAGDGALVGAGGGILDILSVEVSSDATDISFKFTLAGDVVLTDWGKYMVMIDSAPGGDNVGNGWARPIGWGQAGAGAGAETWLGGWVDSGNGLENRGWNGSAWQLNGATYSSTPGLTISKLGTTVTMSVKLADIGVSAGQLICFDAFTSGGGGGDGAIDSLGNPGQQVANWGDYSIATPVCYVAPAPAAPAILGLAGVWASRRRRR